MLWKNLFTIYSQLSVCCSLGICDSVKHRLCIVCYCSMYSLKIYMLVDLHSSNLSYSGVMYPLPVSWETCMQAKKQQLELDIEQQTGSKSGKEYIKAVYCHPAYLIYMQSTSCKMPGWMKQSWNQD